MPRTRRRWIGWTLGGIAVLLLFAIGWVVVRGIGAVTELQQVQRTAGELRTAIAAQDSERAGKVGGRIAGHAASARSLTSDPIWRGFEFIPGLGPNFTAVREVAEVADTVADEALSPVLEAASDMDLAGLGFENGRLDLEGFHAVREPLGEAAAALQTASTQAGRIDAEATLGPLRDAVLEMRDVVAEATEVIGTLHGAAVLLPPMLGEDEPRFYIVAMQNNAELRSSGGIVGAFALVRAEHGELTLVTTASTPDFRRLDAPLPLSDATAALFGDGAGTYVQNATNAPEFSEAAALIAQRWEHRFDQPIDGVLAVDAVVAKHLVSASGTPMSFGPYEADGDEVLDLLLSRIYAEIPDPKAQDEVFSLASAALFDAALGGTDTPALMGALATASEERRIRIWSAHDQEQAVLDASTLGGGLPIDDQTVHLGVLLNDTTGGKMDYYASASARISVGVCQGEPTTRISFTFANDAPADAAQSLPPYVTADGYYGVEPGHTRTLIAIYGPEGAIPVRIDRDGASESVQTALLGTRNVVQHEVDLAPGETTTITVDYTGARSGADRTELLHTPMVGDIPVAFDALECGA